MRSTAEALHLEATGLALRAGGRAGGRRLFDRLSITIRSGERWVVLGPNGAGKSSLLGALAGIFAIDQGEVRLQGRPLGDWQPAELADWRAWSPPFWSDPFPATVEETARLASERGHWWQPAQPGQAAHESVVVDVLHRLDLQALAAVDVRQLSGGERQRVALATALLQGAPLLLLDEPAAHLDLSHQRLLLEVLYRHSASGGAVIASVHDLNLAWELATHVVLLDRDDVQCGRRETVMTPEAISRLFGVEVTCIPFGDGVRFATVPITAELR